MLNGEEKLLLSGSRLSRPFFHTLHDMSGNASPKFLLDLSPSPNDAHFEENKELLIFLMAKNGIKNFQFLQESFEENCPSNQLIEKIDSANIICVGGGSARHTIQNWDNLSITSLLREKVREGSLIGSGGSAGAIIWFDQGYSDSRQYEVVNSARWNHLLIRGTGTLQGWVSPHHSDRDSFGRLRRNGYRRMLQKHSAEWKTAYGIDRAAALICINGMVTAMDLRTESDLPPQSVIEYAHTEDGSINFNKVPSSQVLDF